MTKASALLGVAVSAFLVLGAEGAIAASKDATANAREASLLMARKDFGAAIKVLDLALGDSELESERRALLLSDRGVAHWRLGQAAAAIKDFNEAITLFPENAAFYNNRGNVLYAIGMMDEALKDFDRALLLAPRSAATFSNRAAVRLALGQTDEGIADFSRAIAASPELPVAHNGRGQAHLDAGRPYAALRDLSRTIDLDPQYATGYRNRAKVRISLGQFDEAVGDLTRAVELMPDDPAIYITRARAYLDAGNARAAVKDLGKAIALAPDLSEAYSARGMAYASAKVHEQALADFAAALERDPRNVEAYVGRAQAHHDKGVDALSLPDIERALRIDPNHVAALRLRGRILEAAGQAEGAIADYRQVARNDPNDKVASEALLRLTGEVVDAGEAQLQSGLADWSLVRERSGRIIATYARQKNVTVPLETYGGSVPKLVAWEIKDGLFEGVGVLTFEAGEAPGIDGAAQLTMGAIVDLYQRNVPGIEPIRHGSNEARWVWREDGVVAVAGSDGVERTYKLRTPRAAAPPRTARVDERRTRRPVNHWESFFGNDDRRYTRRQATTRQGQRQRRQKPKSLFELLFQ
ncbi:MAG: tetratricopeptide repeat protein [Rhizobiales bacterium]|nr:tetratricopeptide repeat protein [Hyphomicrobiales bacterium]